MKLILQKDVKNLGKAGDQVNVKKGYARNYLLPKDLAMTLNETRLKEWKHKKSVIESRVKQAVLERATLLQKIQKISLTFERESQSEGRLFGSVTPTEISFALEKEQGLLIDKRDIKGEPLKMVGEHKVVVALDAENTTELKVIVKKIKTEKSDEEKEVEKESFVKRLLSKAKKEDPKDVEIASKEESEPSVETPSGESKEEDS